MVALAPFLEAKIKAAAGDPLDFLQHHEHADGIGRSAAEIERLAADGVHSGEQAAIGADGIVDMQHVAHLAAVAEHHDRLTGKGA